MKFIHRVLKHSGLKKLRFQSWTYLINIKCPIELLDYETSVLFQTMYLVTFWARRNFTGSFYKYVLNSYNKYVYYVQLHFSYSMQSKKIYSYNN